MFQKQPLQDSVAHPAEKFVKCKNTLTSYTDHNLLQCGNAVVLYIGTNSRTENNFIIFEM